MPPPAPQAQAKVLKHKISNNLVYRVISTALTKFFGAYLNQNTSQKSIVKKRFTMQMNPYLSFKGECEAAFKFYEQCLGGQPGAIFRYAGTPLAKTFWAARFGMLVDRFGIPWLINCDGTV